MKLGLALVFAVVLWDVRADVKECPHLDCSKDGPNCVAVKDPDNACERCSCNATESENPDSKPDTKPDSEKDAPGRDEAKSAADAGATGAEVAKKTPNADDNSPSKPNSEAHSNSGAETKDPKDSEHSTCGDCPEGCMVTMFRGKCTGCASIEDPNTECR